MSITYRINLTKLRSNVQEFSEYGEIYFPTKTNHNQYVLDSLKSMSGFEVDSVDHLKKVLTKSNAHRIIYSNVAKSEEDIEFAIRDGVRFYTVDDIETLDMILNYAHKYKIKDLRFNLRLNVYDIYRDKFIKKKVADSRLGTSVDGIKELIGKLQTINDMDIKYGISFYVQAEVHTDKNFLIQALDYIMDKFAGYTFNHINIGGGASIDTLALSAKKLNMVKEYFSLDTIVLEPGRYLVGDIVEVESLIKRLIERKSVVNNSSEQIASLSIGIYHGLLDARLHNRAFEYWLVRADKMYRLTASKNGTIVLRGPTADSIDMLGTFTCVEHLQKADKILVKNVGAYVEVLSSKFCEELNTKYEFID